MAKPELKESLSEHLFTAATDLREQSGELLRIENRIVLTARVTPSDLVALFSTINHMVLVNSLVLTFQGTHIETYEKSIEAKTVAPLRAAEERAADLSRQLKEERQVSLRRRIWLRLTGER